MTLSSKIKKYVLTSVLSMLCSGCGFHMQHARDLPDSLSTVHIKESHFFDHGLTSSLRNYFQGMQANITESQKSSPLTIEITQVNYHNTSAALDSGSNAITNTYYANASLTVLNAHQQKILGPKVFTTSHTISQNSAIINTSAKTHQVNQELTRTLVSSMTSWLNTPSNIKVFEQAIERDHAN